MFVFDIRRPSTQHLGMRGFHLWRQRPFTKSAHPGLAFVWGKGSNTHPHVSASTYSSCATHTCHLQIFRERRRQHGQAGSPSSIARHAHQVGTLISLRVYQQPLVPFVSSALRKADLKGSRSTGTMPPAPSRVHLSLISKISKNVIHGPPDHFGTIHIVCHGARPMYSYADLSNTRLTNEWMCAAYKLGKIPVRGVSSRRKHIFGAIMWRSLFCYFVLLPSWRSSKLKIM